MNNKASRFDKLRDECTFLVGAIEIADVGPYGSLRFNQDNCFELDAEEAIKLADWIYATFKEGT